MKQSGIIWDSYSISGQVAIGGGIEYYADPCAWFEIGADGTNKGILLPRVANTTSIAFPKEGLEVYDKSDGLVKWFDGIKWVIGGKVKTVNDIEPDSEGNVVLLPDDIGAASLDDEGRVPLFQLPDTPLTGRRIIVDKDNNYATDDRTDKSKYSMLYPFKTIQAAISSWANPDVIEVRTASTSYTENITLPSVSGLFRMILDGVILDGTASLAPTINSPDGRLSVVMDVIRGSQIRNTGNIANQDGSAAVNVVGALRINGDTTNNKFIAWGLISSVDSFAVSCGGADPDRNLISNLRLTSTNYFTVNGRNSATYQNCIMTAPNNSIVWYVWVNTKFIGCKMKSKLSTITSIGCYADIQGCDIYSETGTGITGSGWADFPNMILRGNRINAKTGGIWFASNDAKISNAEIMGNVIGVRDAATQSIRIDGTNGTTNISANIVNRPIVSTFTNFSNLVNDNFINTLDTTGIFPLTDFTY